MSPEIVNSVAAARAMPALSASTKGAEIVWLPLTTVIEAPADDPKVSVPPSPGESV